MATNSEYRLHQFSLPTSARQNTQPYNRTGTVAPQYTYTTQQSTSDLSNLAHRFSQQSIQQHDFNNSTASYTPMSHQYQQTSQQAYYQQPQYDSYTCPHTIATRTQRQQYNTQQYQSSHPRELSSLVERMVTTGEQCLVCTPSQEPPPEDEGFGDMEDDMEDLNAAHTLGYRRSSDFSSANYVAKAIRVRKQKRQKADPNRWRQ
ncbi:hypothetical protein EJ08DRAFT_692624 [Tothia fuscella]|uniref:Uncharacterized protein n=1 Tax=Tothia fuscella TaxID=1048955 RepID=A0A9P4P2C1_9PEZI|nr:hypothetical protein EJ08DRAFT_692624 [Tothia fuscella]